LDVVLDFEGADLHVDDPPGKRSPPPPLMAFPFR
jgi:hypothetical protein